MVVREKNVLGLPRGPFLVGFEAVRHAIDWQTLVIQHHASKYLATWWAKGLEYRNARRMIIISFLTGKELTQAFEEG